ncbi:MAG: hypothetical protein VKL42_03665 [Snowella sp.]|nr:hypothetical protein [Snowella sp.]
MNIATQMIKVYDEIIELIAKATTPKSVINFHLSDTAQNRLEDLIYNTKNIELTQDEKQELDAYLILEYIMTLAKAKAHQYLNGAN